MIRNAQDASGGKMGKHEHNQKDAKEAHLYKVSERSMLGQETSRIEARGRNELQEMEEQSKGKESDMTERLN